MMNQNSKQPEFTFNNTNYTTSLKCQRGHEWTSYGASLGYDLVEGTPCDCGEMLFHTEKCPCCEQKINKHIPNKN
jgi:hypothetical protein